MTWAAPALGAGFLPETKGHSVEEITQLFERPARQAVPGSLGESVSPEVPAASGSGGPGPAGRGG